MPDYAQGKIYALRMSDTHALLYVGSTTSALKTRLRFHISSSRLFQGRKLYSKINFVGWPGVEHILLEAFPCASRDELQEREAWWIDALQPTCNVLTPYREAMQIVRIPEALQQDDTTTQVNIVAHEDVLSAYRSFQRGLREQMTAASILKSSRVLT